MSKNFWFIVILTFFISCKEAKKNENWIDNILLSEEDIIMATSFDLNSLLKKSDLANSDQLSNQKKILINAFNSSFKSSLLGFNVDIPQKFFIVAKKDNLNGAVFWAGELTSDFLFKQTLNNFFEIDDFSSSEINSFFIKEYNLYVSFNKEYFIVGFSPEKKYVMSKLNTYFNDILKVKNNLAISKFLENTDDIGFYFSNERITQISNRLNNSIFNSQLSNLFQINQFENEIYVSLNFLKNQISFNTFSYNNNQLFYKDKGVNSDFKNILKFDEEIISFGFINSNFNQKENLFTYTSFFNRNDDLFFFNTLRDQKFISTLNGEMSFLISDSLTKLIPSGKDTLSKNDFWEDDFNEIEDDFKIETPTFLVSFGVKDSGDLVEQLRKINNEFVNEKSILVNDFYLYLSNNILHISNKKELLNSFNYSNKLNTSLEINPKFYKNPLYAEMDLKLMLNFLQLRNLVQFSNKQFNLFDKITFTGNNNNLSILIDVISNDDNSLKMLTEMILKNKFLEPYL